MGQKGSFQSDTITVLKITFATSLLFMPYCNLDQLLLAADRDISVPLAVETGVGLRLLWALYR